MIIDRHYTQNAPQGLLDFDKETNRLRIVTLTSIVQRVENWYADNLERLKSQWPTISIRSYESTDPVLGKVTIEAESDRVAAYVTFWNKGGVDAERMDLPEKRISVIDDRAVSPSEDIDLLLDSYFLQLAG